MSESESESEPMLVIDTKDPTPPYEQLRRQLADLIAAGVLADGERLPPVRQLAADLGLAPGTVARTYAELKAHGLVRARPGGGTKVKAPTGAPRATEDDLARLARQYVAAARALHRGADEIVAAVQHSLDS